MSIYRKFIESAASEPPSDCGQFANFPPSQLQPFTAIKRVEYQQQGTESPKVDMLQRQKSRAHMALSPIASVVGSTISSTPKSHQYKKLVESHDHYQLKSSNGNQRYHPQTENHYVLHQLGTQMTASSCHNIHYNQYKRNGHAPPPPPPAVAGPLAAKNKRCLSIANIQLPHGSQHLAAGRMAAPNSYSDMHPNYHHHHHHHNHSHHQRAKSAISSSRASSTSLSPQQQQQQQIQLQRQLWRRASASSLYRTEDPVLLKWMQAMRFETELECLTALQARTLAIDEHSAAALGVRNSQLAIKEMRLESDMILMLIDCLIDSLPVNFNTIEKFALDFSELYVKLLEQTKPRATLVATGSQPNGQSHHHTYCNQLNENLTIINCTPRKSQVSARTLKPLDKLSIQIREICIEMAHTIQAYQVNYNSYEHIDNGTFEAMLRKIKELLGKFVEISIRAECANIVRALDHDCFGQVVGGAGGSSSSSSSLRPVRPFESSTAHLPQKWALIALWQLTQDDGYICRVLTEKWQTGVAFDEPEGGGKTPHAATIVAPTSGQKVRAARRLDYSTKYDNQDENNNENENIKPLEIGALGSNQSDHSLRNDYEKLVQICQNNEEFCEKQKQLMLKRQQQQQQPKQLGALSSALKSKQQLAARQQLSTIELLIDIIISQPNKHERVDMINFLQENKLVDVDELDQSVSAAFHTSNQYKVAALRILIQLCINDQAIKTILKCFSTPPPKHGHPIPENKIIKSIFECYQTGQEHIYQNETMIHPQRTPRKKSRKRVRHHDLGAAVDSEQEYSDYGSRQTTNSAPASSEFGGLLETNSSHRLADADHGDDDDDEDYEGEGEDSVVMQAILLLKQITQPFLRGTQGQDYYTLIGRFSIESLVRHLTNIIHTTSSREMLLHSLEALANISFITTEPLKHFGAIAIILEMFRNSKSRSKDLELRDQTVTILANACDKNLLEIVSNGGLEFLLSCLEICPTRMASYRVRHDIDRSSDPTHGACNPSRRTRGQLDNRPRDRKPIDLSDDFLDDLDCACDNRQSTSTSGPKSTCLSRLDVKEMAALERIHQKTAVGFSRIASDQSTTWMVLKYGGVKQMIDLCKLSHKRNHSDIVLVALLVALKKISKVIGCDTFRHYNALDLIELEPNRALEIYGRLYASEV